MSEDHRDDGPQQVQRKSTMTAVSLARQVGAPLAIGEHLDLSVREALQQIAGPERAMFLPQSERFVATSGDSRQFEWVSSDMTLGQLRRMLGDQDIVLHLNVEARGGATVEADVEQCLVLTDEADDKLHAYSEAVTRKHGNVECSFFLLGPDDVPNLVTDVILLCDQKVNYSGFEANAAAVEATAREALKKHPSLLIKGMAHRHPGSGPHAVFHSAVDEKFLEKRLMPVIAQHLFVERGWSRPLTRDEPVNGSIVVPLDSQRRRSVKLDLTGTSGNGSERLSVSLEGKDVTADVFSLVFSKDDHQFCRALRFSSCPIVMSKEGERLAKIVDREDLMIVTMPAAEAGVAPARVPDDDEIATEVRRKVSIGWTYSTSHGTRYSTGADERGDAHASSLASTGLDHLWSEGTEAGLSQGLGDSLSGLLEMLTLLMNRIAKKVAQYEEKHDHVVDRRS